MGGLHVSEAAEKLPVRALPVPSRSTRQARCNRDRCLSAADRDDGSAVLCRRPCCVASSMASARLKVKLAVAAVRLSVGLPDSGNRKPRTSWLRRASRTPSATKVWSGGNIPWSRSQAAARESAAIPAPARPEAMRIAAAQRRRPRTGESLTAHWLRTAAILVGAGSPGRGPPGPALPSQAPHSPAARGCGLADQVCSERPPMIASRAAMPAIRKHEWPTARSL